MHYPSWLVTCDGQFLLPSVSPLLKASKGRRRCHIPRQGVPQTNMDKTQVHRLTVALGGKNGLLRRQHSLLERLPLPPNVACGLTGRRFGCNFSRNQEPPTLSSLRSIARWRESKSSWWSNSAFLSLEQPWSSPAFFLSTGQKTQDLFAPFPYHFLKHGAQYCKQQS